MTRILNAIRRRVPSPEFDAVEAAPPFFYEDDQIVETVVASTRKLRERLDSGDLPPLDAAVSRHLLVLTLSARDHPVSVLDFGGACGETYFWMNRLAPDCIESWRVVETPRMTELGRLHFASDRLIFEDDLAKAISTSGPPDLVIASGVLQYLPRPDTVLDALVGAGARGIYLTRTMVTIDGARLVTTQTSPLADHGPQVEPMSAAEDREIAHPIVLLPEELVLAKLSSRYDIGMRFHESEARTIRTRRGDRRYRMMGALGRIEGVIPQ